MRIRKRLGFTLVELIVVVILLAIVSVYAASRYIGLSGFSAFAIQDSVISVARQVQLNRMHSNVVSSANPSFILSISTHCIGSRASCLAPSDNRSDWVSQQGVRFSATPNITTVEFDLFGNPLNAASAGVEISVQASNSQTQVFICPNGLISMSGCS